MTLYYAIGETSTGEVIALLRPTPTRCELWHAGTPAGLAKAARVECCRRTGQPLPNQSDRHRWAVASAVLRYLDLPADRWRWQPKEPRKHPRRDATAGQDAPPAPR